MDESPMELFRKQALNAHNTRLRGDVMALPKVSHWLLTSALLLWLGLCVYWLITAQYARKETVRGWLKPTAGETRVYSDTTGIIKSMLVEEGDQVSAGQPLAVINGDRILPGGDRLEEILLREFEVQRAALENQLARHQSIYQQRVLELKQRVNAAERELAMIRMQIDSSADALTLMQARHEREIALHQQGFLSEAAVQNAKAQLFAANRDHQQLLRGELQQQNLLNQLETQHLLLPQESSNSQDALLARLSELAQQVARLHGQRAQVVTAPRAGIVHDLRRTVGQRAPGAQGSLLTLLPSESKLCIELLLPVSAAGFVKSGQPLRLRYDAFPYQKFGSYQGTVERVSDTVSLPAELASSPIATAEPMYRVTARLDSAAVQAFGQQVALKSGMTLSADIRLSQRSLLQWLLEPLYSLRGRYL